MGSRRQGLLKWMMNNLTSVQKHLLSVIIMSFGLFILTWVVVGQMNTQLSVVNGEIAGLTYQDRLRSFLQNVYIHKYLSLKYTGDSDSVKEQMLTLQKEATEDFRSFQRVYQDLLTELVQDNPNKNLLKEKVTAAEAEKRWKAVRVGAFQKEMSERATLHENLLNGIYSLLYYGVSVSGVYMDSDFIVYQLVEATSRRLPRVQEVVDRIATLSSMEAEDNTIEIIGLLALLRRELDLMQSNVSRVLDALSEKNVTITPLFESYSYLSQLANEFIEIVEAGASNTEISTLASRTIGQSFIFWNEGSDTLFEFLQARRDSISLYKWLVILSSMIFISFAFLLGLYFVKEGLKQLTYLKRTALRIGRGDLSARVPIYYNDELGKVCLTFNRMALIVEQMAGQFQALKQATQKLAKGDFSARVKVSKEADEEVKEAALAFNKMAESFEAVVSRLHRLVIDLTSSATQIAASSKQQEAVISEQGATTRQISVTASEISATSKDFAKMIHEVGLVAEETSRVAARGQSNLGRMVSAMENMEDAAFSIASRLKNLSEKAGNITGISTTISEVSKQTHLLSLNAAIQAEKAGEAGQSFAVIAREIRTLADQTAASTLDIEKIVTEIADAIKSSVMGVDDFTLEIRNGVEKVQSVSEQLNEIISKVKTLVDRFERVDLGMKNQSEAAEQINTALLELTEMANDTSTSMSQFFTTIESLDKAALDLRGTLEKIR